MEINVWHKKQWQFLAVYYLKILNFKVDAYDWIIC